MIPPKNTKPNQDQKLNNMPSVNPARAGFVGAEKTQAYATIVYPESAPDEWQQLLAETHVRALISPLHDRDMLPDQSLKKPHYHVMIIFDRASSRHKAQRVFEIIGGVGCEPLLSIAGYARYLTHQDDPDKAQYDVDDVIELSGADYEAIKALPEDKWQTMREIIFFICDHHITSYSKLVMVCNINNYTWFKSVMGRNAYAINCFLKAYASDKYKQLYNINNQDMEVQSDDQSKCNVASRGDSRCGKADEQKGE